MDQYRLECVLGRGAFSTVWKATKLDTNELVAIKQIETNVCDPDFLAKNLVTEISVLQMVNHPNIITLKEIVSHDEMVNLVMEYVEGGSLFDMIVEHGAYSERISRSIVSCLLKGISYLHSRGIAHRDLKPENILFRKKEDFKTLCITDFGLSKIVREDVSMSTICGTPGYVAPEILEGTHYDRAVDQWALGVITYTLLCGFPPFVNANVDILFEMIRSCDYSFPEDLFKDTSTKAKDFIKKLLVVDPVNRMKPDDALNDPWIREKDKEKSSHRSHSSRHSREKTHKKEHK